MSSVTRRLLELGIIEGEDEVQKLRLASLLHDVGHFPFSHVIEAPVKRSSANGSGDHEQLSAHLINNSCLRDCFETYTPNEISSVISKQYVERPLYSLLISSDLDVDRIDYLMRDAHETGVSHGLIDTERLVRTVTVDSEGHLAVEAKGRQALENFLIARYHMYQTVYYHKTVVCFELMLQRIYEKLLEEGKAYCFEEICKLSDDEFYGFNDSYVWHLLQEYRQEEHLKELIARFERRQRLKMIKEVQGIAVSGRQEPEFSRLSLIDNPIQLNALSEHSSVPNDWIFYSTPKPLEILSRADEETAVRVIDDDGTSMPIARDPHSVISMLYDSCSLSSRVYTKDEYQSSLLNGLQECFDV